MSILEYLLYIDAGIVWGLFCLWLTQNVELWGESKEQKRRARFDYEIAQNAIEQNKTALRRSGR